MSSAPPNEVTFLPPEPGRPAGAAAPPEPGAPPAWRTIGVLYAFGIGLAATVVGALLVGIVAVAFGADADDLPSGVNVLLTIVQDGAFVGAALLVAGTVARPRAWHFGLRGVSPKRFAAGVVLAFLAFTLFSVLYAALVDVGAQEELPDELGADGGTLALVVAAFLVTVIAPIAEELFFRGFVFGTLRGRLGLWPGALITGAIFGAIHAGSAPDAKYLPLLAVFGVVLCLLYARTGSLYPCIVLHALNNCIAFAGTRDGWDWEVAVLLAGSLGCVALFAVAVRRVAGPAPVPVERGDPVH